MSHSVIRVTGISKQYHLGRSAEPYFTLRESLSQFGRHLLGGRSRNGRSAPDTDRFWALKDISFEVHQGEVLGVIGRNGAGKTTLLKILSRITEPTEGRAELRGRVASLLEVGTGFHPELTGRENIYLSGAILGMRQAEIERNFEAIVGFAEVERFIDTPIKRYSSGMYVRLAFAVAAHLEPEILLVDEVLAVGDAQFQKKCVGKMHDVAQEGRTILFVSHNMAAMERLCHRAILLDGGRIVDDGPVRQVVARYLGSGMRGLGERVWTDAAQRPGNEVVRLRAVSIKDAQGHVRDTFTTRDPILVAIEYEVLLGDYLLEADFYLYNGQGVLVFVSKGEYGNEWRARLRPVGAYQETCHIPGEFLNDGRFTIDVGITTPPWRVHAVCEQAVSFEVIDDFSGQARGSYTREWPGGVVRPLLAWTSVHHSG